MAFQKPRDPYTKAGVWSAYVDHIGAKRVAALVGVSLSSIYNATDPDHPFLPADDLTLYETLDTLCVEAGHPAPFARYYAAKVGAAGLTAELHIEAAIIEIGSRHGDLCHAFGDAVSPSGEAGSDLSENERIRLRSRAAALEGAIGRLLASLDRQDTRRQPAA